MAIKSDNVSLIRWVSACFGSGYAGLGYALEDRKGKVLAAGCSQCFATNPKQAEGLAFFEGLQRARREELDLDWLKGKEKIRFGISQGVWIIQASPNKCLGSLGSIPRAVAQPEEPNLRLDLSVTRETRPVYDAGDVAVLVFDLICRSQYIIDVRVVSQARRNIPCNTADGLPKSANAQPLTTKGRPDQPLPVRLRRRHFPSHT
ncbi:hypothetical protein MUK42_00600 [Musa troglodytarum]|uniref:RNase H type-1 domain-containing protein n=1 Tax=Musa troglodytarum TaxID=320322 RepID=A0A9E7G0B3_9LILI|nr:hypothetical protein MUK42_00600 [Musa troglodytarum]